MARDASTIDLDAALVRIPRVRRSRLPVRLWHWRHVFAGGAAVAGLVDLGAVTEPAAPVSIIASLLVSTVMTPELRRWALARWRCVVMPHRIRRTFLDGAVCSPDGRTPAVRWTSTLPCGVRIRLRCPIGMRTQTIEEAADLLRAACGADEIMVVRDPRSRTVFVGLRFAPRDRWWDR